MSPSAPPPSEWPESPPEGTPSILDTDLYKLTMQLAVRRFFPETRVSYRYTNRTPQLKFSREAFEWLRGRIQNLENVALREEEHAFLREKCSYLNRDDYLTFLRNFRFEPSKDVHLRFEPTDPDDSDRGDVALSVAGLWTQTVLYEIPLLALLSEAYFKFVDRDWTHAGQREAAARKAAALLADGCIFSEFGSRRRRDYRTHELVMQGLVDGWAAFRCRPAPPPVGEDGRASRREGRFVGTSNVHFAMRFGVAPVGTVAHEWFMGIAAITAEYRSATERALGCWMECYGPGVLSIALTDTFGTDEFLKAFMKPVQESARRTEEGIPNGAIQSYAQVMDGVRQDSGDPLVFVDKMREFYDRHGLSKKIIVFSDSLDVERCKEYREYAEENGFKPSFGIGTFLTNDFGNTKTGEKSKPLNIVLKLASANGKPAIKLSDDLGKNTGDSLTVQHAKQTLGYVDSQWEGGDESARWDTRKKKPPAKDEE